MFDRRFGGKRGLTGGLTGLEAGWAQNSTLHWHGLAIKHHHGKKNGYETIYYGLEVRNGYCLEEITFTK
jgi:hypothetical protein